MDYARDEALYVGCSSTDLSICFGKPGQDAIIFAIGLGTEVLTISPTSPTSPTDPNYYAYGDRLLRYLAAVGDDGNPATDPCLGVPVPTLPLPAGVDSSYQCGNYYFAQYSGILNNVFTDIFNRIYTRITQ